jgi:phosphoribosylanthranilate isomerase
MSHPDLPLRGPRPFVKICGVRTTADLAVCDACGVDAVGLVFAEGSPRRLEPSEAMDLLGGMPDAVTPIGLFVDPEIELVELWPGTWIQLHGDESPERVASIAAETGHRIVKAIPFDADACRMWDDHPNVEMLLIDGPKGGSGRGFDHAALAALMPEMKTPIVIAGGKPHSGWPARFGDARDLRENVPRVKSGKRERLAEYTAEKLRETSPACAILVRGHRKTGCPKG